MQPPFDAVLVVSFGGPLGRDDIRPFLANVLRGRRIPPSRIDAVAEHYEHFDGVSPLTRWTYLQAKGLATRLARSGPALPVYVGMRNWQPFLHHTLAEMARDGVRRAIGFVTAAHRSESSCGQYKQNVADARAWLKREGLPDVDVHFVSDWHLDDGFVGANAMHIAEALKQVKPEDRDFVRVLFTAHSIPVAMSDASQYVPNLKECAQAVMRRLGRDLDWGLAFQSRSGRPEDPWLEPDILEVLKEEKAEGTPAVIISPIGFVSDHVEVLHDLDHEAAELCRAIGLPMVRARAANDNPLFLDTIADVVRRVWARESEHRRLPIVSGRPPREEGMPPATPTTTTLAGRVDRVSVESIPTGRVHRPDEGC